MSTTTSNSTTAAPSGAFKIHLGIAEQGKLYALEGNHKLALLYLRHAMHLTVEAGDPEVFFRVYLEAALESMEHLEYFDEVLSYTEQAIQLYEDNPPESKIAKMDLAYIHQKKGVILLKQKQNKAAAESFQTAINMMDAEGHAMPLSKALSRWAMGGLHLDNRRILAEQQRNNYFNVRKDNVDPKLAIKLPNENMLQIH
jgi:tetratricopeptide (TPR) repeat protein